MCCAFPITIESISTWINLLSCFCLAGFFMQKLWLSPFLQCSYLKIYLHLSKSFPCTICYCGLSKSWEVLKPNLCNVCCHILKALQTFPPSNIIWGPFNKRWTQDFLEFCKPLINAHSLPQICKTLELIVDARFPQATFLSENGNFANLQ